MGVSVSAAISLKTDSVQIETSTVSSDQVFFYMLLCLPIIHTLHKFCTHTYHSLLHLCCLLIHIFPLNLMPHQKQGLLLTALPFL